MVVHAEFELIKVTTAQGRELCGAPYVGALAFPVAPTSSVQGRPQEILGFVSGFVGALFSGV